MTGSQELLDKQEQVTKKKKINLSSEDLGGQEEAAFLQIFQARLKRKGIGRGQDRVRNEYTSQVSFAFKGSSWRKASRAAVLS